MTEKRTKHTKKNPAKLYSLFLNFLRHQICRWRLQGKSLFFFSLLSHASTDTERKKKLITKRKRHTLDSFSFGLAHFRTRASIDTQKRDPSPLLAELILYIFPTKSYTVPSQLFPPRKNIISAFWGIWGQRGPCFLGPRFRLGFIF